MRGSCDGSQDWKTKFIFQETKWVRLSHPKPNLSMIKITTNVCYRLIEVLFPNHKLGLCVTDQSIAFVYISTSSKEYIATPHKRLSLECCWPPFISMAAVTSGTDTKVERKMKWTATYTNTSQGMWRRHRCEKLRKKQEQKILCRLLSSDADD